MKQYFTWYQVKDITNLSEVSCVLAKELEGPTSYQDNDAMGGDIDEGRQRWYAHMILPLHHVISCDCTG